MKRYVRWKYAYCFLCCDGSDDVEKTVQTEKIVVQTSHGRSSVVYEQRLAIMTWLLQSQEYVTPDRHYVDFEWTNQYVGNRYDDVGKTILEDLLRNRTSVQKKKDGI